MFKMVSPFVREERGCDTSGKGIQQLVSQALKSDFFLGRVCLKLYIFCLAPCDDV